jgi:hypothetical protein
MKFCFEYLPIECHCGICKAGTGVLVINPGLLTQAVYFVGV